MPTDPDAVPDDLFAHQPDGVVSSGNMPGVQAMAFLEEIDLQ
ncbi:MAG: hypothetical protein ACPL8I_11120 [Chloroflexaceae bacterium]